MEEQRKKGKDNYSAALSRAAAFIRSKKPNILKRTKSEYKKCSDSFPVSQSGMNIGDKMPDKTVYAGISPDTNNPMFTAPEDADLTMTFDLSCSYARQLNEKNYLGHNDWRLPTIKELNQLYQYRDRGCLKGSFNETDEDPASYYWSSAPYSDLSAYSQRFSDGVQLHYYRDNNLSIRCVR